LIIGNLPTAGRLSNYQIQLMKFISFILVSLFIFSCNEKKKAAYTDLFRSNLQGSIHFIQDSMMVIDSGRIIPDSICYRSEEYKSGFLDNTLTTDSSGKNRDSATYTHYGNGLMKSIEIRHNGRSSYSQTFILNPGGEYAGSEEADSAGHITHYRDLHQNEFGQWTSARRFDNNDVLILTLTNEFDKQHLVSHTTTVASGGGSTHITFTNNDHGDPILETRTGDSSYTRKFTYESSDPNGNWSQRTEWINDKPIKTVTRKFIYYHE
jgi:hypothetical protein